MGVAAEKMFSQAQAELFDFAQRLLAREGVNRVLHRVRGQDLAIVALKVSSGKVPRKLNVHIQVLHLVTRTTALYLYQPRARFPVPVLRQYGGHSISSPDRS